MSEKKDDIQNVGQCEPFETVKRKFPDRSPQSRYDKAKKNHRSSKDFQNETISPEQDEALNFYEMNNMSPEKAQGLKGPGGLSNKKQKSSPNKTQGKAFNLQEPDESSAVIQS